MDWKEAIEVFHLQEPVEKFVLEEVEAIIGGIPFFFYGSDDTALCPLATAHVPHLMGTYDTFRYGLLSEFCLGREGLLPDGKALRVVETKRVTGCLGSPIRTQGVYFIGGDPLLPPVGGCAGEP